MISRTPLRDEIYRQVLDRIQRGDIPPGSRVRDVALAAQLGVSRTPIREALLRLARDGVLEASMGRGFRVPGYDPAEIRDVGHILGALEALALRLTPDPDRRRLDRLAEVDRRIEQTRGDVPGALELEDEWHRVLLEECPNRRLLELIGSLRQVARRYLAAYLRDAGRLTLSTLPHAKIAQALTVGGCDVAATAFEQQWRKAAVELESWARTARSGAVGPAERAG